MSISKKYGRTYHYDFSPGTTSDDRINKGWWDDMTSIKEIIQTEKLDGENTCMNGIGIFARSHAAPTRHPWADYLKGKFSMIQNDLKENEIELFGENLYAIHSIIYPDLEDHFFLFAVRCKDMWLSWEEVNWYADFFDFKTVPYIGMDYPKHLGAEGIKADVLLQASKPSVFGSLDVHTEEECTKEGIVTRNIGEYHVEDFKHNVFKYVRKGHVSTDTHWTRNWKRAPLKWEKKL